MHAGSTHTDRKTHRVETEEEDQWFSEGTKLDYSTC